MTEFSGRIERLLDMVEKVIIMKGEIPSDPTMWEIHMSGGIIRVDAEHMDRTTAFRKQYLKTFNTPAPGFKDDWIPFVQVLGEMAETTVAGEESELVYIAKQIMEKIRELPITDDQGDAGTGRALLRLGGYLCLSSTRIGEIVEVMHYHIAPNVLSTTMTALGYKAEGTRPIRCNGKLYRFWWFKESIINENADPSEIPEEKISEGDA
ncbi:hypothetical protein V7O66_02045 [Methanolobus sp. ZRKC3]|uniref:hypothetical protein n=1 Tax=Methanolobus sp. ZRKC3 TaxID=3125786 RepID=UPI0032444014